MSSCFFRFKFNQILIKNFSDFSLERCKSREGANLEYLKNVILSFLMSTDTDSKRHMVNAIGAVLKFSPSENKSINLYFNIKEKK